jgi:hypothetical protein
MEALKKQASKLREHVAKQQQVPASVSQNSRDSSSHQSRASDRMPGVGAKFERSLLMCLLISLINFEQLLLLVLGLL